MWVNIRTRKMRNLLIHWTWPGTTRNICWQFIFSQAKSVSLNPCLCLLFFLFSFPRNFSCWTTITSCQRDTVYRTFPSKKLAWKILRIQSSVRHIASRRVSNSRKNIRLAKTNGSSLSYGSERSKLTTTPPPARKNGLFTFFLQKEISVKTNWYNNNKP